ncbi:MAG: ArnT family glycosyltransferase [Chloroflexota bacterium]
MLPKKERQRRALCWALAVLATIAAAALRLIELESVPFGWHPDEATKALLARDVLDGAYFPAFFSAFTGREALYVYFEAGFFALLGESVFAARLLSAFTGILTVALTYTAGRRLFNRRVGLIAAVFMATSLWHLIASRNGYRAVMQPLVQLPVVILLLGGLKANVEKPGWLWGAAGVGLGLTQYTYTAARFFPIVVVAVIGLAALWQRQAVWERRRGLLLMTALAVMVFLPLGVHFIQNPLDFYGRAAQISVFSTEWAAGDPWSRLWQSVKETARMFTVWGDINYRFNVAGQPVFGTLDGLLFYAGVAVALWRLARRNKPERLAYAALFMWLIVMILPMTLSAESLPYYQRAIGVLPAIYFLPALAVDAAFAALQSRISLSRRGRSGAVAIATLALLALLGARSYGDYFWEWHETARNDDDRRVAMVYVAEYLRLSGKPQPLYISSQYVQHPTLALLSPEHYDGVRWFDAGQSMPLPAPGEEARYIMLMENAPQAQLLKAVPALEEEHVGYDRFERPVFVDYEWTGTMWPAPEESSRAFWSWATTFAPDNPGSDLNEIALPADFGDILAFRGHSREPEQVQPGDQLQVVLFWELLQRPDRQYTFFAHLLDQESRVIAGSDANTYPTIYWPEHGGELLLNYFPLSIPADLSPGEYQLEIGVYHQPSGERLAVLEGGEMVADRLLLTPVTVERVNG